MSETDVMRKLQKAASVVGSRLFRQQVGLAWISGKVERVTKQRVAVVNPGDVILRAARPFNVGCVGMSDLGGFRPLLITQKLVGSTVAQYAQAEVKDGARTTKEQQGWIDFVNSQGGVAGVVRNEADLYKLLGV